MQEVEYMKHDLDILDKLAGIPGPAGCESEIQAHFLKLTKSMSSKQYTDPVGNCYAEITGNTDKRVVFTAHCDTVGFMVKYIDDQGFIFSEDIGGNEYGGMVDPRMLPGCKVDILSRHNNELVPGHIMPVIPYHLVKDEFDEDNLGVRYEMAIDIGARTEEEAQLQVDIGDYVIFRKSFEHLGELITTPYLDDRLGVYLLYLIGKHIKNSKAKKKPTVVLCTTVCEESVAGTAGPVVEAARPDVCVTIDVMPATDMIIHDADFEVYKKHGKCKLGDGPVIARGIGVTDEVFKVLEGICTKHDMDYQIELAKADTDNKYIHSAGARTGLVMIPVRNAHTPVETFDIKDLDATLKLCQYLVHTW
jgi:endoglucanase